MKYFLHICLHFSIIFEWFFYTSVRARITLIWSPQYMNAIMLTRSHQYVNAITLIWARQYVNAISLVCATSPGGGLILTHAVIVTLEHTLWAVNPRGMYILHVFLCFCVFPISLYVFSNPAGSNSPGRGRYSSGPPGGRLL